MDRAERGHGHGDANTGRLTAAMLDAARKSALDLARASDPAEEP